MKIYMILILALLFNNLVISQTCLPSGITFSTQSEVDDFPINYPGCTEILGNVCIGDCTFPYTPSTINNLNGLSQITSINGNFSLNQNPSLIDIDDLTNLETVGGSLNISDCDALLNLNGLVNLTTIGHNLDLDDNDNLMNLNGLNSISNIVNDITISRLNSLTIINGFPNLMNLSGNITIENNIALTMISGFSMLNSVDDFVFINNNNSLVSFSGLGTLTSIGDGLELINLPALNSLAGFNSLNSIESLIIDNCDALINLNGLNNVDHLVLEDIVVQDCGLLSDCALPNICLFLENGGNVAFSTNASGCNSESEVETACNALPVELIEFNGKLNKKAINLFWQTASEINNTGFEIQRSNNVRDWEIIDFIYGKGTTNEINEYHYLDSYPFSGINYYQLKQIDFDGTYEYSKVIAIEYRNAEKNIQVFPNPSNRLINIQIDNPSNQRMKIKITDNLGRKIWESELIEGESNWRKEMGIERNGIYFIIAQIGNEVFYERVIILNEK